MFNPSEFNRKRHEISFGNKAIPSMFLIPFKKFRVLAKTKVMQIDFIIDAKRQKICVSVNTIP